MPSPKRNRSIFYIGIVIFLVILYVVTGPSNTERNAFYRKTVAVMEARAKGVEHILQDRGRKGQTVEQPPTHVSPEEELKGRLKEAEHQAKKSADERYNKFKDSGAGIAAAEQVADQAALAGQVYIDNQKSVAGRVKMPAEPEATQKEKDEAVRLNAVDHSQEGVLKIFEELISHSPITIFSKSYCPHSARAKRILLEDYYIEPAPYVVELDLHDNGPALQDLLLKITGRRTVPNVLVNGKSAGGGDDMAELAKDGTLSEKFMEMGDGLLKRVRRGGKAQNGKAPRRR